MNLVSNTPKGDYFSGRSAYSQLPAGSRIVDTLSTMRELNVSGTTTGRWTTWDISPVMRSDYFQDALSQHPVQ